MTSEDGHKNGPERNSEEEKKPKKWRHLNREQVILADKIVGGWVVLILAVAGFIYADHRIPALFLFIAAAIAISGAIGLHVRHVMHRKRKIAWILFGSLFALHIGTLAASGVATFFEATVFDIRPAPIDGSSLVVPFTIRNMGSDQEVTLRCYVNLIYVQDAGNQTAILRDVQVTSGTVLIPHDSPYNFNCDASKFLKSDPDGSLVIGIGPDFSGQSMKTEGGGFMPPIKVLKMCVAVTGEYERFGTKHDLNSKVFQWPWAPHQLQWIEGPIAFDSDERQWIPPGTRVWAAWALRGLKFSGPLGNRQTDPSNLKCDFV